MILYPSSTKEIVAILNVCKGNNLMQGIGYTGDRRGCESNLVAMRRCRAEHWKEEAVASGRLEGQRERVSY